tara:strand:- start:102 stop:1214 length:1113 start_codon:yes stop_codon:yes gene_type:complete
MGKVSTGVCYYEGLSKPYKISININKKCTQKYFKTQKEAEAARAAHRQQKVDAKFAQDAALADKRANDKAKSGKNCSNERDSTLMFTSIKESHIQLNDSTVADFLLDYGWQGLYLPVQMKTAEKQKSQNCWEFQHVLGYTGMPVVCHARDQNTCWIYDGADLDRRGIDDLKITPGGINEKLALQSNLTIQQTHDWLIENAQHRWPAVTEEFARNQFSGETHKKEKECLDAYMQQFPEEQCTFPLEQNGHTDLMSKNGRLQFKKLHTLKNKSGLHCKLTTRCGKDENGNQRREAYPPNSFDFLITGYKDPETDMWHFWKIPHNVLFERGYFKTDTQIGKTSIVVHGPIGLQPDPNARNKADTWTRQFYLTQ